MNKSATTSSDFAYFCNPFYNDCNSLFGGDGAFIQASTRDTWANTACLDRYKWKQICVVHINMLYIIYSVEYHFTELMVVVQPIGLI